MQLMTLVVKLWIGQKHAAMVLSAQLVVKSQVLRQRGSKSGQTAGGADEAGTELEAVGTLEDSLVTKVVVGTVDERLELAESLEVPLGVRLEVSVPVALAAVEVSAVLGTPPAELEAAGIDGAGIEAAGLDGTGIEAAGIGTSGVGDAGIEAAGVEYAGLEAAGVETSVVETAVFEAAVFEDPLAVGVDIDAESEASETTSMSVKVTGHTVVVIGMVLVTTTVE